MSLKKLLATHKVDTVVLACMDFRFRELLPEAIKVTFGIDSYDSLHLAGGAKNLGTPDKEARREVVLADLRLAVDKHGAKRIVLLNHENCGKYAEAGHVFDSEEGERDFHERELGLAGTLAAREFPDTEILLGYVWVDGNVVRIKSI